MIRAMVIAACLGCAANAANATRAGEEDARQALAHRQYLRVIEIYKPTLAVGQALGDAAHYRRAIAFNQLGRPLEAWDALTRALAVNPAGTFATTPARLAELRSSILSNCKDKGKPACADAAGSVGGEVQDGKAERTVAPGPREDSAATSPATIASEPDPGPSLHVHAMSMEPRPTRQEPHASPGTMIGGMLGVQVLVLAGVAWLGWMTYRRDRRFPAGQQGLERLRDDVADMLARLARGRGEKSLLQAQLQLLLPLLEQEAGRCVFRSTGREESLTAGDQSAAEVAKHLTRTAPDALSSPASDIEAAFRRPAY